MNTMELCNYLEKIRVGRKMTQEAMLHGIVSIRTYQRYRNGTGDLPYEKLEMFAERLGIPSKKLLYEFEKEKNTQLRQVNALYNAAANRDVESFKKLKNELNFDLIIEEETKKLYQHSLLTYDWLNNKISDQEAFTDASRLIGYPEILKHDFITDVEALIMSAILDMLDLEKQEPLIKKLSELYENDDGIMKSSDSLIIQAFIIRRLIKYYGLKKNFPQVIKFSEIAIKKGQSIRQYYLWDYFYYYKALAYFRLEDFIKFEESLFRCYSVLHMEGNYKKIEKFTSWIEKDFNVNFDMFVLRHLQKKVK